MNIKFIPTEKEVIEFFKARSGNEKTILYILPIPTDEELRNAHAPKIIEAILGKSDEQQEAILDSYFTENNLQEIDFFVGAIGRLDKETYWIINMKEWEESCIKLGISLPSGEEIKAKGTVMVPADNSIFELHTKFIRTILMNFAVEQVKIILDGFYETIQTTELKCSYWGIRNSGDVWLVDVSTETTKALHPLYNPNRN